MRIFSCWLVLVLGVSFAQGSIQGTLYAPEVRDYVIIACYPSDVDGCDDALSGVTQIASSGSSARFDITGLEAGSYVLIAWLDIDGSGTLDEEEIHFLLGEEGEPVLSEPPAGDIEFVLPGAHPAPAATPPGPGTPPRAGTPRDSRGAQPSGAIPPSLVGIWQQTRAAGGDYKNTVTGATFSVLTGFSVKLVIGDDGGYYMAYATSGTDPNCAGQVTYFEQSTGTASVQGSTLVLEPSHHQVDVTSCAANGPRDLGTAPIVYDMNLSDTFDYYGLRTYELTLEGGGHPLDLEVLHREPLMPGYQPAQPADFVLGQERVYTEFIGTWAPEPNSDLGFYDPATGAFYLPEYNGSGHEWVRFGLDGYELARAWREYNVEGVCSKDYVYYERGDSVFSITKPPSYQGDIILGNVRLEAADARLVVNIHDCDELDEVLRYDLVPLTSYYAWYYRPATDDITTIPEGFSLSCPWGLSEWQFMVCDEQYASYMRR